MRMPKKRAAMCLECIDSCENAPDKDNMDLENEEDDPSSNLTLKLLDNEIVRKEDSLDDHLEKKSVIENVFSFFFLFL